MDKIKNWLNTPVKGTWLSRRSVMLFVALAFFVLATVLDLAGYTALYYVLSLIGFLIAFLPITVLVINGLTSERRRNKP